MHVNLTPFLEKNTTLFMKELWTLLASANQTASHIPQPLLEAQAAKLEAQQKAQLAVQVGRRVGGREHGRGHAGGHTCMRAMDGLGQVLRRVSPIPPLFHHTCWACSDWLSARAEPTRLSKRAPPLALPLLCRPRWIRRAWRLRRGCRRPSSNGSSSSSSRGPRSCPRPPDGATAQSGRADARRGRSAGEAAGKGVGGGACNLAQEAGAGRARNLAKGCQERLLLHALSVIACPPNCSSPAPPQHSISLTVF